MYAAYQKYIKEVKFVLEHEADVSADDVFGQLYNFIKMFYIIYNTLYFSINLSLHTPKNVFNLGFASVELAKEKRHEENIDGKEQ